MTATPAHLRRTVFGLPVVQCAGERTHDWHTDGRVFCPGYSPDVAACEAAPVGDATSPGHHGHTWEREPGGRLLWCRGYRAADAGRAVWTIPTPDDDPRGEHADRAAMHDHSARLDRR